MTGSKVAQYEILDRLGSGGMGEIFRAKDGRLNRMVAIKVLPKGDADDDKRRRRFLQEAQAASGLNHPNIITVHDILTEGGTDYLVMELVTGQTLADLIPEEGMLPSDVLNYGAQMAAAFAAAHAAGIVHRDIKPGNIMITGTRLVKVLDFGLAKATFKGFLGESAETLGAPLTNAGTIMGTVNYMSPEQAEGKNVDSRSDIFSFGIVLYQMITGRSAFASDSVIATMSAILRDEPTPVRELSPNAPAGLAEIIEGCLRKDREERTQSIDEVRVALEALKKSYNPGTSTTVARSAAAATTRISVPPQQQKKPATLMYAIAAAGVVIAGAGGWWIATQNKSGPAAGQQASATAIPSAAAPEPSAPGVPETVLTNDSIAKMVEAKVRTSAILDHIRASKTNFNLSTDEVIRLTKAGVPDAVIQGMRNPTKAPKVEAAPGDVPSPSKDAHGAPPPAPAAPAAAAPPVATLAVALADGMAIAVQLTHDIPNDAKVGTPLKFRVAKDIVVDGSVVIAKGAEVNGSVAEESKKAVLTLKKMTYEFTDVEAVNRQKLKLRATPTGAGGPSRKAVEQGKKKVKDVASAAGTDYLAYLDGAQTVTMQR